MDIETYSNGTLKKNPVDKIKKSPSGEKVRPVKSPEIIMIPAMKYQRLTILVEGVSPLIVHAWSKKAEEHLLSKHMAKSEVEKKAIKNSPKVPEEDFNGARYLDKDGCDCFPAIAFKTCVVEAAMAVGVHKTDVRKSFFIADGLDMIKILDANGKPMRPQMRRDITRVNNGDPDVRFRPEYIGWRCRIPIVFLPTMISSESLLNLFNYGGFSVGVGEWRPQKNGQFGRFQVAEASGARK